MMIGAFLIALTATFHPPKPTVGDLITVDFGRAGEGAGAPRLDPSPDYEIVSHGGSRIVIRTFAPKPIALSGTAGGVRFRNLVVPVQSLLAPKDTMKPAPLAPPRLPPQPRMPLIAIAAASVLAIAGWVWAYFLSKQKKAMPLIVLAPAERFRAAVRDSGKMRQPWAALADATRAYLAGRGYGAELTTTQLLAHLHDETVADILNLGDLEKFSPWGAPSGDFAELANRALTLIDRYEPRPEPQEQAA